MKITQAAMSAVEAHGADDYPNEACGVLVGPRGGRTATEAIRVRNIIGEADSQFKELGPERKRDRYELDSREHRRIQREADDSGRDVIGYYHSHPDHPAKASITDASVAIAGYAYLIVSVEKGRPVDANAFVADRDRGPFRSEPLEII